MPIDEYSCSACGAQFEHWHASLQNITKPICPQCGSAEIKRRFSAPARSGSSETPKEAGETSTPGPRKSEVFGRKELNATLRSKGIKPAGE